MAFAIINDIRSSNAFICCGQKVCLEFIYFATEKAIMACYLPASRDKVGLYQAGAVSCTMDKLFAPSATSENAGFVGSVFHPFVRGGCVAGTGAMMVELVVDSWLRLPLICGVADTVPKREGPIVWPPFKRERNSSENFSFLRIGMSEAISHYQWLICF